MTGYLYQGSPQLEEINARIMADREARGVREATDPLKVREALRRQRARRPKARKRVCMEGEER